MPVLTPVMLKHKNDVACPGRWVLSLLHASHNDKGVTICIAAKGGESTEKSHLSKSTVGTKNSKFEYIKNTSLTETTEVKVK